MAKHPRFADWEENNLAKSLSRFPERREKFTNHGGDEVVRLATPENIEDLVSRAPSNLAKSGYLVDSRDPHLLWYAAAAT